MGGEKLRRKERGGKPLNKIVGLVEGQGVSWGKSAKETPDQEGQIVNLVCDGRSIWESHANRRGSSRGNAAASKLDGATLWKGNSL